MTTVKSYLENKEQFKPFTIELVKGEFLEIPSSHTLSNEYQFTLAKYKMRSVNTSKSEVSVEKRTAIAEEIYHLTNKHVEVFRHIDENFGHALWWIIFKDWLDFCKDQVKLSDQGK